MRKTPKVFTITDLKREVSTVFDALGDGGGPVIITRDGRKAGVLMSVGDHDRLIEKCALDAEGRNWGAQDE